MSSGVLRWSLAGWVFGRIPKQTVVTPRDTDRIADGHSSRDIPGTLSDTDRAIVAAIRRGETQAFGGLIDAHGNDIMAMAYRLLRSRDAAKDAVSHVFAAVWEHRAAFRPTQSVRGYLFAAVRNRCLDLLRRDQSERRYVEQMLHGDAAPSSASWDDMAAGINVRATVATLLARLPDRRRQALALRFLDDLSYEDVAHVMGVSVKAAKHLVARSLDELRAGVAGSTD